MEAHKLLGPGLLESTCKEWLAREFELRAIYYDRQKAVPIVYKDVKLDCGYRIDLVVEGQSLLSGRLWRIGQRFTKPSCLRVYVFQVAGTGCGLAATC